MPKANVVATVWEHKLKELTQNKKYAFALLTILVLLVTTLVIYRFSAKDTLVTCAFKISRETPPATKGDAFKVDTCVDLEVVSTPSERTLGLSGRPYLARNRGMLFDFVTPGKYCMWMKEMNFALDIIWLNEDKEIVGIKDNITPETYPTSFCGPENARYVLEVNSGVAGAGNLQMNQRLRF